MFDWLFEGRPAVYWMLGVVAVLPLLVWWRTRKRGWLYAAGALAALAGAYFVLSLLKETDGKQVERKLNEMAAAVNRRDTDGVFQHVSDQFASPQGKGKAEFRDAAKGQIAAGTAGELVVWDVEFPQGITRDKPTVPVVFLVKARGVSDVGYRCEATFHLDADGQWRLKGFKLFDPVTHQEVPLPF